MALLRFYLFYQTIPKKCWIIQIRTNNKNIKRWGNLSIIKYKEIFEALGNDKRIKLYELINKEIFISKSRLAEELNLNRANLNHHLEKLKNAGLIMEKSLFINRRKQTFIVPLKEICYSLCIQVGYRWLPTFARSFGYVRL